MANIRDPRLVNKFRKYFMIFILIFLLLKKKMNEKSNLNVLCFLNSWGVTMKKKINYRHKSIEKKKRLKLNQTWIFTVYLKFKYEVKTEKI